MSLRIETAVTGAKVSGPLRLRRVKPGVGDRPGDRVRVVVGVEVHMSAEQASRMTELAERGYEWVASLSPVRPIRLEE